MGYNCLAVDLRSGNKIRGVENLTALRARELGKRVRFSDAMQDVITALNFVKHKYNPPKLLVLGSSYSAGLALKAAGDYPGLVDGALAFSPGEYFVKDGKPYNWVTASAAKITVPVLIASARAETIRWASIYEAIDTDSKLSYTPADNGEHGARCLWERYEDSQGYWAVMDTFLKGYFSSRYRPSD
jgi:pimeloyl-ACP methyl ester carboxylesterase